MTRRRLTTPALDAAIRDLRSARALCTQPPETDVMEFRGTDAAFRHLADPLRKIRVRLQFPGFDPLESARRVGSTDAEAAATFRTRKTR